MGEGSFIPNYSWIQSYAQMEDTANPGLYLQVTCNVGYTPSQKSAPSEQIVIGNFYGEDSITVEAIPEGKWDSYGTPIPEDVPVELLYQKVDEELAEQFGSYATGLAEGAAASQVCTAWAPMWGMNGTEPISKEMNDFYFENYKTLKEFKIDTGFRIW